MLALLKWPLLVIGILMLVICGLLSVLARLAAEQDTPAPFHADEAQASWLLFGAAAFGAALIAVAARLPDA